VAVDVPAEVDELVPVEAAVEREEGLASDEVAVVAGSAALVVSERAPEYVLVDVAESYETIVWQ
jgi:hypothetical protein